LLKGETVQVGQEWQLQEAKNRFSEVVRLAQRGPQMVTVRGMPSAVVVSFEEYRALVSPKQTLLDVMRNAPAGFELLDITRSAEEGLREVAL